MNTKLMNPVSHSLNILAIFFRYPPQSSEFQSVADYFAFEDWRSTWLALKPDAAYRMDTLSTSLARLNCLEARVWQTHFAIEQVLPVPPWTSVYLDHEGVINTNTTLAVEAFLSQHELKVDTDIREPVDHIGILMMIMAYLAEQESYQLMQDFYHLHVKRGIFLYLSALKKQPLPAEITGVITLCELTLEHLFSDEIPITMQIARSAEC